MGAACGTAAVDSALPAAVETVAAGAANPCAAIIACTFAPYSSSIRLHERSNFEHEFGPNYQLALRPCEALVLGHSARCSPSSRRHVLQKALSIC
jgi:hypothetical protein